MSSPGPLSRFLINFEPPATFLETIRARFPEIDFARATDSSLAAALPETEAMMTWSLSEEELAIASRLRWVQWTGAGVENAPLKMLQDRGILLTNNRGVHAVNIAEHVLAMMLAFTRALPFLMRAQARHEWADDAGRQLVMELNGSSLLIVGCGNIGTALAERAAALGLDVTMIGRTARPSVDGTREIVAIEFLGEYLPAADHVAICLPLTPETRGLFDRSRFAEMKRGAVLHNIGRGPIVVTSDLVDALKAGHLGGAGLDVVDPEPLPSDHPLWDMPNVILTAHTAGATPEYWTRAGEILIENIMRYRNGQVLRNLVRYDLGY